jgi:hypothetical protein
MKKRDHRKFNRLLGLMCKGEKEHKEGGGEGRSRQEGEINIRTNVSFFRHDNHQNYISNPVPYKQLKTICSVP